MRNHMFYQSRNNFMCEKRDTETLCCIWNKTMWTFKIESNESCPLSEDRDDTLLGKVEGKHATKQTTPFT